MRIARMSILLALVVLFIIASATSAFAVPVKKVFPNGDYAISDVKDSGIKPLPGSTASRTISALASGSGGATSYSGSKTITTTIKYYTYLGSFMSSHTARVYWEWQNGVVTRSYYLAPMYSIGALFTYYEGTYFSCFSVRTWNYKYGGERYTWCQGHFTQQITKLGTIAKWDPIHEFGIRGNGSYWWKTTP